MDFSTKYDVGQELWFLVPAETEMIPCEHCGHIKFETKSFKVNDEPLIIESIQITAYGVSYYNDLGGHFTQELDEAELAYFTSRQAAQDECDRRNGERR